MFAGWANPYSLKTQPRNHQFCSRLNHKIPTQKENAQMSPIPDQQHVPPLLNIPI